MNDDLISRQAVLKQLKGCLTGGETEYQYVKLHIDSIPPVNPQEPKTNKENIHREREQAYMQGYEDACKKYRQEPKTGHWIDIDDIESECSECGHREPNERFIFEDINFCAKCGARMVEPQESDHKCHTCKHYLSGERDGSCGSYICKEYSNWESEEV